MPAEPWWLNHKNLALVARHMLDDGAPADEVTRMLGKPWNYEEEFLAAKFWANRLRGVAKG